MQSDILRRLGRAVLAAGGLALVSIGSASAQDLPGRTPLPSRPPTVTPRLTVPAAPPVRGDALPGTVAPAADTTAPLTASEKAGAPTVRVGGPSVSARLQAAMPAAKPAATPPATLPVPPTDDPAAPPSVFPADATPMATEPPAGEPPAGTPPAGEPLQPIAQPRDDGPAKLEAASFNDITPGQSTLADVEKVWGAPKEIRKQDATLTHRYAVEPFDRVEVSFVEDTVVAIVIRFGQAFPAEAVAQQLQLGDVRPVLVSNQLGEILGQAYPERGVLFAFESGETSGKPSQKVAQIILEPLSAEPFVLRAETHLENRVKASLLDLQEAIKLDPQNARALWLLARGLAIVGEHEKALDAVSAAIALDAENPHYRVTRAQALGQLGKVAEAATEAQKAVELSKTRPHVKARALCLLGDLAASGPKPDYRQAIQYHGEAVQAAAALLEEKHPALRLAAKEVLVDAHLGAAHDIAWGDWKEKDKSVPRWLERAAAAAEDLAATEGHSGERQFRVCTRALAACVGMRGSLDPAPWAQAALDAGRALIDASRDPVRQSQLQWDLGMALYDALQTFQMRDDHAAALKYGEQAIAFLDSADPERKSPTTAYLLGRLHFRLGAIHSLRDQDHRAAMARFEKAVPLLQKPIPPEAMADVGRLGETFVSMGVSYWEAGQRKKAVELTAQGVSMIEHAVKQGTIEDGALAIPYTNLASMHRQLGASDAAARYQKLAAKAREGRVQ